jgi:quinol monooxygenase YgiN
MHGPVHVIATVELQPGRREDFLREFWRVVPLVRAEAGCLEYGPAVDVPTSIAAQAPLRENVVTIIEKWESLSALEAHLVAPHMLAYRPKVKDLVVGSKLQILRPAESDLS